MTDEAKGGGTPTGQVNVSLAPNSQYLGSSLPVEVRDSSLRLVHRGTGTGSIDLPEGLYEVSTVLGDGQKHSAFVDVKGGETKPVEFGEAEAPAFAGPLEGLPGPLEGVSIETPDPYRPVTRGSLRPTYTAASAAAPEESESTGKPTIDLIEVTGAKVTETRRTKLTFQCDWSIDAVPTATVRIGEHMQRVSLPISPQAGTCVVKVEPTSVGFHAQAWISADRREANGLQNLLSTGYVLEAAGLAHEAIELLRGKYVDPAGAALGALVLQKAGQLEQWETWVENLARDVEWLPDGKVLLLQLRAKRGEQRPDDLQLLLKASAQRVMYAETCSILIDLLRRWPASRGSEAEVRAAVDLLAQKAPYIDRDSVCLTVWLRSEDQ